MIKVHHLSDSRSQKTVWLLEELDVPYELELYTRQPNLRAPPEMKALHPMASAPMLEVDGRIIPESAAICDFILRRYGDGRLTPAVDSPDLAQYLYWQAFGVVSGMAPIMNKMQAKGHGLEGSTYEAFADVEMDRMLSYLESELDGRTYLLGDTFTAADIQVSFVPELARVLGFFEGRPNTEAWLERLTQRPAYQRSLEKGVTYAFSRPGAVFGRFGGASAKA